MSDLIYIRVLQHDTEDQIRIGAACSVADLGMIEECIIARYEKETAWCGGFKSACEKYYKRIAIVNSETLEVIQTIYPKVDDDRAKVIWRTHVGVKVYMKDGVFTDCHNQNEADRLTDKEVEFWLSKSTPHCTYWMEELKKTKGGVR